ncbi:MAG: helix-turn-helix transcriptional regulator [Candidatus Methanomethylophilaceae archaeon]|jgi:hypothetical protein
MADEKPVKASKHVCLCKGPMTMISYDPELDIIRAMDDMNCMKLLRGLSKEPAGSPFTDGLYGMDYKTTADAIRRLSGVGLVCSKRDGPDHIYFINPARVSEMVDFFKGLVHE